MQQGRLMRDRWKTLTTMATRSGNAMAVAYASRFCPAGHGELKRSDGARIVQLRCRECGFVRQFNRIDAPPRIEDVDPIADHPTVGQAPKPKRRQ